MSSTSIKHYLLSALLLMHIVTYAGMKSNSEHRTNKQIIMSDTQRNKEVIRAIYEEALNKRNMKLLHELVADEFTGVRGIKGPAGMEAAVLPLVNAFPDIQWNIEELIAEEDKVVVKWKWAGASEGVYQNLQATHKTVTNEAIAIYQLKKGKVISAHVLTDRLGFLQQMEAVPLDISLFSNGPKPKNTIQFIDKFIVPAKSKEAFLSRVKTNRNFIKTLPGFIEDHAYESIDEKGNLIFITLATWESDGAVKAAKDAVNEKYKEQGFDMAAFLQQLQITIDRGLYKEQEK